MYKFCLDFCATLFGDVAALRLLPAAFKKEGVAMVIATRIFCIVLCSYAFHIFVAFRHIFILPFFSLFQLPVTRLMPFARQCVSRVQRPWW